MKLPRFEQDFAREMRDPIFRAEYLRVRARIDVMQRIIARFEKARRDLGISKAELARRIGVKDAQVRRLFSWDTQNPTIQTLTDVATALGLEITVTGRRRVKASAAVPLQPRAKSRRNARARQAGRS